MHNENWLKSELKELKGHALFRTLTPRAGVGGRFSDENDRTVLNFSSNDYLNFSQHPQIIDAARRHLETTGCGSGASRLMSGNLPIHEQLELAIARHKNYPAALLFGSGFLANTGIIPALTERGDRIYADRLVHASIIAGIRLSGARLFRFQHNDTRHLEKLLAGENRDAENSRGRKLVITESVFSMDGDRAPLTDIATVCEQYGAMLMVDEAHATGVFGADGAGLINELGLEDKVNIAMGTFSKALGNYGGFCACSEDMRSWLINKAPSFIYTTALPPAVTGGCLKALELLKEQAGIGEELLNRAGIFLQQLREKGVETGKSESQIIPVIIGDSRTALRLSERLREEGIIASAVRPPTVPQGSARLRLSLTLAHTKDDLAFTAEKIAEAAGEEGLL
ncbi:MAG: 8-amino-7-oxononanoate synthase [Verrucomicrobiota bacterium]